MQNLGVIGTVFCCRPSHVEMSKVKCCSKPLCRIFIDLPNCAAMVCLNQIKNTREGKTVFPATEINFKKSQDLSELLFQYVCVCAIFYVPSSSERERLPTLVRNQRHTHIKEEKGPSYSSYQTLLYHKCSPATKSIHQVSSSK